MSVPSVTRNVNVGVELGYAEVTTTFSGTAADTTYQDVTGLSITVSVGARPVEVVFFCRRVQNTGTGGFKLQILEGSTTIADAIGVGADANDAIPVAIHARSAPVAGSVTYKVQFACNSANGTPQLANTATSPARLWVREV